MSRNRYKLIAAIGLTALLSVGIVALGLFMTGGDDGTTIGTSPAHARVSGQTPVLNENCVISILNRAVRVNADGSWQIDNIPTNRGRVRARVTCVENGATRRGQTGLFTIGADEVTGFDAEVQLDVINPVPISLGLSATSTTLAIIGVSAQVTVTGALSDGTDLDLTLFSDGTDYSTTNPAIATVSADGLVTAVSSGTALISATNEGAIGIIRMQVVLSGDSDGDGISDDIEVANGLNPNDPVDAIQDQDADGLTTLDELMTYGTSHTNADTDGDGIDDGEEVVTGDDGFITDPLLEDTDNDTFNDGDEVAAGTDPTDSASNPGVLASTLEISPSKSVLIFNTLEGGNSEQQLTVLRRFSDGSTIDVTSGVGTTYDIDNLLSCTQGSQSSLIIGLQDGQCTVTATNSGEQAQATITVITFAPTPLAAINPPGRVEAAEVAGDMAYLAVGSSGLQLIDVFDRESPALSGIVDTPGKALDVLPDGDRVIIADECEGLLVADVSDPSTPVLVTDAAFTTYGDATDLAKVGDLLYVAYKECPIDDEEFPAFGGIYILNVEDPDSPIEIANLDLGVRGHAVDVTSDGATAAVGFYTFNGASSGVMILDVSDPTNVSLDAIPELTVSKLNDVTVSGTTAYVASDNGFTTIDISVPSNPVLQSVTPVGVGGQVKDVAVQGQFAVAATGSFGSAVPIFDINASSTPIFLDYLDFNPLSGNSGNDIAMDDEYIYLGANFWFFVGRYVPFIDTGGVPPTVAITSPLPGKEMVEGTALIGIAVEASDDVAVAWVELLIDGDVVNVDSQAPYAFAYEVPLGSADFQIGARAADFNGNTGTATDIQVTVLEDMPPVVSIISPVAGTTLIGGEVISLSVTSSDDKGGPQLDVKIDGIPQFVAGTSFQRSFYLVPTGALWTLEATATDSIGQPTVVTRTHTVLSSDPLTTVEGTVVANDVGGTPIEGASVWCSGINGLTDSSGLFSIGGVPTLFGDLTCAASLTPSGGTDLRGISASAAPNRGGVTNVGDLTVEITAAFLFESPRSGTGEKPVGQVVGDMNGDGVPDIVTVNETTRDVSVLLGVGDGTFLPEARYPASFGGFINRGAPRAVRLADMNGDGRLDVVTSNGISRFTSRVSVLIGNGDGTLRDATGQISNGEQSSLGLGDFNGDGNIDAVVSSNFKTVNSSPHQGGLSIFLGNGDGFLQSEQIIFRDTGFGFYPGLAVGLFNQDAFLDVALAKDDGDVSVFLGNGGGSFQPGQVVDAGSNARAIVAGQVDSNAFVDLLVLDNSDDTLVVLLGNGDGTFQDTTPPSFAIDLPSLDALTLAHLDTDSNLDVAVSSFSGNISVLTGTGDSGLFASAQTIIAAGTISIGAADMDGDSDNDLVAAFFRSDSIGWLQNDGSGVFSVAPSYAVGAAPESIVAANFNSGDGFVDFATANRSGNTITTWMNVGDGTFASSTTYTIGNFQGPSGLVASTIDEGNSDIDLVATNQNGSDLSVLLGNGDGTFQDEIVPRPVIDDRLFPIGSINSPEGLVTGLFDGDTFLDVVTANDRTSSVSVMTGNGDGTFNPANDTGQFPVGNNAGAITAGHLNGDLNLDVVTASFFGNQISVLLGDGLGGFGAPLNISVANRPRAVAIGDLDNDGFGDIITTNTNGNDISVFMSNGDGTFQAEQRIAVGIGPYSLAIGDLNADSLPDVVITNGNSDDISLLLGNGDGTFQPQQLFSTGDFPTEIVIADFDGVGLPDLATANRSGNDVSILLHR